MKHIKHLHEVIKVNIKVGDTVLGGRFKNKKMVVKKIGKNDKGDLTLNGKPLLKFRIVKQKKVNEALDESLKYELAGVFSPFTDELGFDYHMKFYPKNSIVPNSPRYDESEIFWDFEEKTHKVATGEPKEKYFVSIAKYDIYRIGLVGRQPNRFDKIDGEIENIFTEVKGHLEDLGWAFSEDIDRDVEADERGILFMTKYMAYIDLVKKSDLSKHDLREYSS